MKRSTELRSPNHCCHGKVLYILRVRSLIYSACNAHAQYYTVICGQSGSTIFFHIIS